ncbi:MAG: hypothetical protein CMH52_12130 [Myxococcales bacterium]|nr:hypothetical protein [Myxococcales bacterium]|tara:strand:+ start:191 stop:1309 length:1119 start_codon:yes stop_codon:yes gene_type:complete
MASIEDHKRAIGELLFSARKALSMGDFDTGEKLYLEVLKLADDDEAALDGLDELKQLRILDAEGVSATDWQHQYAAGADESIDQPPILSSDIFETLSSTDTEPPSDLPDDYEPITDRVELRQQERAKPARAEPGGERADDTQVGYSNPDSDPFTWPQSYFTSAASGSGDADLGGRRPLLRPSTSAAPNLSPNLTVPDNHETGPSPVQGFGAAALVTEPAPLYSFASVRPVEVTIETADDDLDDDNESLSTRLQMADRKHRAGDYEGSLALLKLVLLDEPGHAVATALARLNESKLRDDFLSQLGGLEQRPRLKVTQQEYVWQSLSHVEGFVLSLIDGQTSYADIIEIATMPEKESLQTLIKLLALDIIVNVG